VSVTVDANVLTYASDTTSARHSSALELLERLAAGPALFYLFWPVAMAYLRIATHASILSSPLEPLAAQRNLADLLGRPHVRSPGEGPGFWAVYENTVRGDVVRANLVPDAHLAALMRQHGVATIWTADRDFRRFPDVTARDPYTER
jgi:toxin-antitoxin system PIN domain toxin